MVIVHIMLIIGHLIFWLILQDELKSEILLGRGASVVAEAAKRRG
jgi:multisubunit Na+/H+ antiporter MnhE subunit